MLLGILGYELQTSHVVFIRTPNTVITTNLHSFRETIRVAIALAFLEFMCQASYEGFFGFLPELKENLDRKCSQLQKVDNVRKYQLQILEVVLYVRKSYLLLKNKILKSLLKLHTVSCYKGNGI